MKFSDKRFASKSKLKPHPPLRTFTELCEEFQIPWNHMVKLLGLHNGPTPAIRHSGTFRNSWYEPKVFRSWLESLKASGVIVSSLSSLDGKETKK